MHKTSYQKFIKLKYTYNIDNRINFLTLSLLKKSLS